MNLLTNCWCGADIVEDRCSASLDHDPSKGPGLTREPRILYVSGPMSGHADLNVPAFQYAADRLREAGYEVMSPAEIGLEGDAGTYADLIRKDLYLLLECEGVAVLEGWWHSRGAQCETFVAGILNMPVRTVNEWLSRAAE